MAKPTYAKLKLSSIIEPKVLEWNDQVIEVKQYVSIQDKLKMISEILGLAADDNRFYNIGKISVFRALKMLEYYTNLSITEKQKEDPIKLYDEITVSNFFNQVESLIPETELKAIEDILYDTVEQIYKYQNSAAGIMETISQDYSNLDLDAVKISQKLSDPEQLKLLKDVVTKLG